MKTIKKSGPHMSMDQVQGVVKKISEWEVSVDGRLIWNNLIKKVKPRRTRAALRLYEDIQKAFTMKKATLRKQKQRPLESKEMVTLRTERDMAIQANEILELRMRALMQLAYNKGILLESGDPKLDKHLGLEILKKNPSATSS